MAEEKYSVELEKLLHDLKEHPAQLLKASKKTAERAQALRAKESAIWYDKLEIYTYWKDKLEEFTTEQRKKMHDLIHKND